MSATQPAGDGGLWNEILDSVAQKKTKNRTVLLLGDRESGKTKLLNKLKGPSTDEPNVGGISLEYDYIDVKDPEDSVSRMDIWCVNDSKANLQLLKTVLTEDSIIGKTEDGHFSRPITLAIITVDLSKPQKAIDTVVDWMEGIEVTLNVILKDAAEKDTVMMKESIENYAKEFRQSNSFKDPVDETLTKEFPLDDGLLVKNVGIPIIIVGTKSDTLKGRQADEALQQALRSVALNYGAGLVYTSAEWKEDTIDTLMQYLTHRLYDFEYRLTAQEMVADQIFIPLGWDTKDKIKGVHEGTLTLKDLLKDHPLKDPLKNPEPNSVQMPIEHQKFLGTLRQKAEKHAERKDRQMTEATHARLTVAPPSETTLQSNATDVSVGAPRRPALSAQRIARGENASQFFSSILENQGQKSDIAKKMERLIRQNKREEP